MRASERSRAKYPLATISAYGPDNRRATKLVVGILRRAGQKDANSIRSWTSDASDVRNDPVIASEYPAGDTSGVLRHDVWRVFLVQFCDNSPCDHYAFIEGRQYVRVFDQNQLVKRRCVSGDNHSCRCFPDTDGQRRCRSQRV